MNVLGDPVDVVSPHGDTVPWRAIAYPFIGAQSYNELARFSDFGALVQGFVDDTRPHDQQISADTLRDCFQQVIVALQENPSEQAPKMPLPLESYLPTVPWNDSIRQVIATIAHLLPAVRSIGAFEEWFDRGVRDMSPAPVPDRRLLHGDARFANVLVDHVHARVELIDYGNGKQGHLFADLARFEVDLWFRGAARAPSNAVADAPDAAEVLQTIDVVLLSGNGFPNVDELTLSKHSRAVAMWRAELLANVPRMGAAGAVRMYTWFLLVEVLKRIRWLSEVSTNGPGVDGALLLDTIVRLRRALDPKFVATPSVVATPMHLTQMLGCTSAWVPVHQQESITNRARNERKLIALRRTAAERGTVRLLAETGQSFLDPRRPFQDDIGLLLERGGQLQVVIANPYGPEGQAISASYRDGHADPADPHPEFLGKSTAALRGALSLFVRHGEALEIRVARSGLGASVLLTPHAAFYEPYLRADRGYRDIVLFDTFELLFEPLDSHGGKLLDSHFDFHWSEGARLPLQGQSSALDLLGKLREISGGDDA
jgi:hypothetical protein